MRRFSLLAAVACLLAAGPALAATPTFTVIDNPADPTFNQLLGINNAGTISGYFGSGVAGHPNQAYTIAAPYSHFLPANVPGSVQTQATGINAAGMVTGFWSNTNTGTDANFGFIRWNDHGRFRFLDVNNPKVASSPAVNQLLGINKSEIAVGFYNDANGAPHGYAYLVQNAQFRAVNIGGSVSDAATGINGNSLICGFFTDANAITHGFVKQLLGSAAIKFRVPGASVTQFLGINDRGIAVGFYVGKDALTHGLLFNAANGNWKTLDDPQGVGGTVLNGLNDKGQVVGFFTDAAGNTHGVLVNNAGGGF